MDSQSGKYSRRSASGRSSARRAAETRTRSFWRRALLVLVGLVVFALVGSHLASLIFGLEAAEAPESLTARIITPVQTGFSRIVQAISDRLYTIKLRSRIELEYNNLKQENEQLMYQAMLVEELQHKLSVYENLYDEISANESLNPLVANVIGRESGNYFSVFTINKGSSDGVQDYMAVTVDGSLVGYTYNVQRTSSTVRTIIDSEASIAALLSTSRDQGTVRGSLDVDGKPLCRMYYLPEDDLPRPGDAVVTSGVGMSFPKGIPIGAVRESTRGMESNKSYVVVEPSADFQHIENVIVLRYQPEAGAVEDRTDESDTITLTHLDTPAPIPTIMIGSEFFQLAPTPAVTATPEPEIMVDEDGNEIILTPAPTPEEAETLEYHLPSAVSTSVGYSTPTPEVSPSPTPSPEPLDLSIEED